MKEKLIADIIWTIVKQGGFQRARIYRKHSKISEKKKKEFRDHIKDFCFEHLYKNRKPICENRIITIINDLVKSVETQFHHILENGKFRFGNSQKFINLYLKLLWVLGKVEEPPHFPVDRIIQKEFKPIRSWTNMSEDEYLEIIKLAKVKAHADNLSLAKWELFQYEKLKNKK